jgi:hypothetical protein
LTLLSELFAHHTDFFKGFQEQDRHIGKGFMEGMTMPRVCGFLVNGGVPGCDSQ